MILDYHGSPTNNDGETTVNASQHAGALSNKTNAFGRALKDMLLGWERYAAAHKARYDDEIGSDCVIGRYLAESGLAIKRLLDGECGGLDCGSISHNILAAIDAQGFKHDGYNLESDGTQ